MSATVYITRLRRPKASAPSRVRAVVSGQHAEARDAGFAEVRDRLGPSRLGRGVRDDQRPLGLDDQAGWSSDRIRPRLENHVGGFDDLRPGDTALGVVQKQPETLKCHDALKLAGQPAEQLLRLTARGYRFSDRQERRLRTVGDAAWNPCDGDVGISMAPS
jgi:hypothetical protein